MAENPWIPLLNLTGTYKIDDLPELDNEQILARAKAAKNDAEKELAYGETISEILSDKTESPDSKKNLATIGVWHFECAVELFEKAVRNFERAKARGLDKSKQKEIELQIKECQKQIIAVIEQKKTAEKSLNTNKS